MPQSACKGGGRDGKLPAAYIHKCKVYSQRYRRALKEVANDLNIMFIDWHELLYADVKDSSIRENLHYLRDWMHPNVAHGSLFGNLIFKIASEWKDNYVSKLC